MPRKAGRAFVAEINRVLCERTDVLDFFSYAIMEGPYAFAPRCRIRLRSLARLVLGKLAS